MLAALPLMAAAVCPRLAALLAPAAAAQMGSGALLLSGALAADDECGAAPGGATLCGFSTLQLRRGEGVRAVASTADEGSTSAEGSALAGSMAVEDLRSSRWGTCVNFGCASFVPRQRCQCNTQCRKFGDCCSDFAETCANTTVHRSEDEHGPIMTLYHQTSMEIGTLILESGFKPGHVGWCGGAIYFARSPQATITKASGINSHRGFMIEAVVSLGKIKHMGSTCDMMMTPEKLHKEGYNSIVFNPVDGDEFVIYNSSQVLSTRRFPFDWFR